MSSFKRHFRQEVVSRGLITTAALWRTRGLLIISCAGLGENDLKEGGTEMISFYSFYCLCFVCLSGGFFCGPKKKQFLPLFVYTAILKDFCSLRRFSNSLKHQFAV